MERSVFGTLNDAIAAFESDNHSQEQDLLPGDIAGTIEIHQRSVDLDSDTDEEDAHINQIWGFGLYKQKFDFHR